MTPIFTFTTNHDRRASTVTCVVAAHNRAARKIIGTPITHVYDVPLDYYASAHVTASLPQIPKITGERGVLVPERMLRSDMGEEILMTALAEDGVYRNGESVMFATRTNNGPLFVRYRASGEVKIIGAGFHIDDDLRADLRVVPSYEHEDDDTLELEKPPVALDADGDALADSFWAINGELEDRFLQDEDSYLADEETYFESGSEQILSEATELLVKAWLLTQNDLPEDKVQVIYRANNDCGDSSGLEQENCDGLEKAPEALLAALERAFDENPFSGTSCEYNDGAYARISGYNRYGQAIRVDVEFGDISAHERIAMTAEYAEKARAWLEAREFPPADIAKICGRK